MFRKLVCFVFVSCLTVVLARDETTFCQSIIRQTCNGFQQCCARRCASAHEAFCTEHAGRISQATCTCDTGSGGGFPGTVQTSDHSSMCRLAAGGSCSSFKSCCTNRCPRPYRLVCSSVSMWITDAVCACPGSSAGGIGTPRIWSFGRPQYDVAAVQQAETEEDYTQTCTQYNRNCPSFRTCCVNWCGGRVQKSQCRENWPGRLSNTLCRCGGRQFG